MVSIDCDFSISDRFRTERHHSVSGINDLQQELRTSLNAAILKKGFPVRYSSLTGQHINGLEV